MSCFPSTKSRKSLASKLQSNLQKLRRSKILAKATTLLLRRSYEPGQPTYGYMQNNRKTKFRKRRVLHQQRRSFVPVYVGELFQQQQHPADNQTNMAVQGDDQKSPMDDKFGHVASSSCPSSPLTVDVRAEMFIAKFREEMRLQRQRSLGKYQEMLARGV